MNEWISESYAFRSAWHGKFLTDLNDAIKGSSSLTPASFMLPRFQAGGPLTVAQRLPRVPGLHPIPATQKVRVAFLSCCTSHWFGWSNVPTPEPITWAIEILLLWLARPVAPSGYAGWISSAVNWRVKRSGLWGKSRDLQEENKQWAGKTMDVHCPQLWHLFYSVLYYGYMFSCASAIRLRAPPP